MEKIKAGLKKTGIEPVAGAKEFYKHYSFWGICLLGILPFLECHSTAIAALFPEPQRGTVALVLAAIVAVLRFIKQADLEKYKDGN